eukprot:GHVT01023275.1.p1 GENE.GHVT01023275.1~~GHVT01023275.1.p1  ORF type:complete len:110 (+),score=5.52 GHVT01023275.1:335-664(+)
MEHRINNFDRLAWIGPPDSMRDFVRDKFYQLIKKADGDTLFIKRVLPQDFINDPQSLKDLKNEEHVLIAFKRKDQKFEHVVILPVMCDTSGNWLLPEEFDDIITGFFNK